MQEPPYHNDNPYTAYGSGSSSQENVPSYNNPSGQNYGNQDQPYSNSSGQNYGNQSQPYGSPSGQNYGNQSQPYGSPVGPGSNQGQNYANQPYGYGSPVQPVGQSNGWAIAGLIVGIISIALCWIPFFDFVPAIVGIILSIVARRRPNQQGLALTGLILSIVGLVISVIYLVILIAAIVSAANSQ